MARGRGQGSDEVGLRSLAPSFESDPVGFRSWWQQTPVLTRISYQWPEDLSHQDLSGYDLTGCDLSNRSLQFADLRSASLDGLILAGANLTGAQLTGAHGKPVFDEHTIIDGDWHELVATPPTVVERHSDGTVKRLEWRNHKGELHNLHGPAVLELLPLIKGEPDLGFLSRVGKPFITREEWRQHDELYRIGGPALYDNDPKRSGSRESWFELPGVLHRQDGPADIQKLNAQENGEYTIVEEWHEHDKPVDGLARRTWRIFKDERSPEVQAQVQKLIGDNDYTEEWQRTKGVILAEDTMLDGWTHSFNGEAAERYYLASTGTPDEFLWLDNGRLKREDGLPSIVSYHDNGVVSKEIWADDVNSAEKSRSKEYDSGGNMVKEAWSDEDQSVERFYTGTALSRICRSTPVGRLEIFASGRQEGWREYTPEHNFVIKLGDEGHAIVKTVEIRNGKLTGYRLASTTLSSMLTKEHQQQIMERLEHLLVDHQEEVAVELEFK